VSSSGISWAVCKSAPCTRQITTPAPNHSVFYRPDALPAAQPTASKHWRPNRNMLMDKKLTPIFHSYHLAYWCCQYIWQSQQISYPRQPNAMKTSTNKQDNNARRIVMACHDGVCTAYHFDQPHSSTKQRWTPISLYCTLHRVYISHS